MSQKKSWEASAALKGGPHAPHLSSIARPGGGPGRALAVQYLPRRHTGSTHLVWWAACLRRSEVQRGIWFLRLVPSGGEFSPSRPQASGASSKGACSGWTRQWTQSGCRRWLRWCWRDPPRWQSRSRWGPSPISACLPAHPWAPGDPQSCGRAAPWHPSQYQPETQE